MYFVQPLEGERYYLRVLLTHVAGATCFEDLRTTHRPHMPTTIVQPTFKAACLARGLLQDDAKWDQCLSEVVGVQLPRSLRQLFASLLIYNNVTNPGRLWDPRPVDKTFFVDGLGGAGKTFLYGCLLSRVCSTNDIALSMASSGIAALLLEGNCTAHSRFKIPVAGLCGSFSCYVPLNSPQAALIRAARLIVWDEAPMAHKHVFEAMNRTFQHVMGVVNPALKDMLFRGKVVVMGGDFREILPVVPRGTRGQIVDASLKRSTFLWHCVKMR